MKKFAILSLGISCALAAALVYQTRQSHLLAARITQLEGDLTRARAAVETETRQLKEKVATYQAATTRLEEQVRASGGADPDAKQPLIPPPAGEKKDGGFMKGFVKMFSDPKMKEVMRSQQKMTVQMMYGGLAQEIGLSPDKAQQVLDILADEQLGAASKAMDAMATGKLKDLGKDSKETNDSYEEQLKNVLGADRYAKLTEYKKTIGERMALDQYSRQLSAGGMPLEPAQSKGLLKIMSEERLQTPASPLDASNPDNSGKMKALQSSQVLDQWVQSQDDYNRRVLARVRGVLTPDQMLTFESAQKQQTSMQKMGVEMSRQFLKGAGGETPASGVTDGE